MGRITPAYGIETVVAIDERTYERSRSGPPLEWSEDVRDEIGRALHRSLSDPDALEIEPGYIRVRFDVSKIVNARGDRSPADLVEEVRGATSVFNNDRDDRDGAITRQHEVYTGVYQPEGASPEGFVGRYGADPEADSTPIVECELDESNRRTHAGGPLEYDVVIPISPGTYERNRSGPGFEWDEWARDRVTRAVENGGSQSTASVEVLSATVWRTHIRLSVSAVESGTPQQVAIKARSVVARPFGARPLRETDEGERFRQPPLELSRSVWISAAEGSGGAEAFIREEGLNEIDSEPEPEPEPEPNPDPDAEATAGSVWSRANPFGGAR